MIRNRRYLIPINKNFFVKHDYKNILEPSETTSQKIVVQPRTDIPSERIIRKSERYLEERWIVWNVEQTELFHKQTNTDKSVTSIFDPFVKSLNSKKGMLHYRPHCSCFISFSSVQFITFISSTIVYLIHIYHIWLHSVTSSFNLIVSFTFQPIPSLEINALGVSLDKVPILDRYLLLELNPCGFNTFTNGKQEKKKNTKGDKRKTSILLTFIGQKRRKIYETFAIEPGDERKLASVLHKYSEYCNSRKTTTILCHKFFTYRQQEGQSFHDFVTDLKKLNFKCELDNLQDSLIKDIIIFGTRDNSLRERLLRECDLTLSKAISGDHAAEETREHAREIFISQTTTDIDKILKRKLIKSSQNTRNQNTRDFIKKCKLCVSSRPRGKSPSYVCNKKNHFKVCWNWKYVKLKRDGSDEPSDQSDYEVFIETINIQNSGHYKQIKNENSDWTITLLSNWYSWFLFHTKLILEHNVTLFLWKFWKSLNSEPDLCPVKIKLSAYINSKIPILGKSSLTLK